MCFTCELQLLVSHVAVDVIAAVFFSFRGGQNGTNSMKQPTYKSANAQPHRPQSLFQIYTTSFLFVSVAL